MKTDCSVLRLSDFLTSETNKTETLNVSKIITAKPIWNNSMQNVACYDPYKKPGRTTNLE